METNSQSFEITSVQDFITAVESLEGNYYFRGESSIHFEQIIASAYRKYEVPFSSEKKTIDYKVILDEYHQEIGYQLSDIERRNFLQFSQHHGFTHTADRYY